MDPFTNTLDLVQRAQGGDREALDKLLGRYYEPVRRIVRARIGPKLRRHVETADILGTALGKAVQIFDRFEMRDEHSLLRWLSQIAEGKIRDAVDKSTAQKRSSDREEPLGAGSSADDDPDPARELADETRQRPQYLAQLAEEQRRLEVALDQLDEASREVIVAREFEGHSWPRVAELTGRPTADAARMFYSEALIKLTRFLARHGGRQVAED